MFDFASALHTHNTVAVAISDYSLAAHTLEVEAQPPKPFSEWDATNHSDAFHAIKEIVTLWEEKEIATQYMVFGEQDLAKTDATFKWKVVPYESTSSCLFRFWQQFNVLLKIIFPKALSHEEMTAEKQFYLQHTSNFDWSPVTVDKETVEEQPEGTKFCFCQQTAIEKQGLFEGETTSIFYPNKPTTPAHFLFCPQEHRSAFVSLKVEEFVEISTSMQQTIPLVLAEDPTVKKVYFSQRTGIDAGQTVFHGHMHANFTSGFDWNGITNVQGKFTVGAALAVSPVLLSEEELGNRVTHYRDMYQQK